MPAGTVRSRRVWWQAGRPRARGFKTAACCVAALVVMGCPADEIHAPGTVARGGGKALSAAARAFRPASTPRCTPTPEFLDTAWSGRPDVSGHGAGRWHRSPGQATAAVGGGPGGRSHTTRPLSPTSHARAARLESDVEEDTASCSGPPSAVRRRKQASTGAAMVQEAVPAASWSVRGSSAVRPDDGVPSAVAAAFRTLGRDFVESPPRLSFATDFGNISRRCPAALIGVGRPGGWAFHTNEGAAEFASQDGEDAALTIAQVLALAAVELCEPVG